MTAESLGAGARGRAYGVFGVFGVFGGRVAGNPRRPQAWLALGSGDAFGKTGGTSSPSTGSSRHPEEVGAVRNELINLDIDLQRRGGSLRRLHALTGGFAT